MKTQLNEVNEIIESALTSEPKNNTSSKQNYLTTAEELLNMKTEKLPYLVENLLPQSGMVAVAGSSDTGKSSWLRDLAIAIVSGKEEFLGFKIHARYKTVIYVSTEDDKVAVSYLLNKQINDELSPEKLKQLRFIFDSDNILCKLDSALCNSPADCVIIDTFTDLYGGDMNAANKVRHFLTDYHNLAQKHNCLFIFLHHTGKKTELNPPSKDNLLGSQGFEAKMRLVIELRRDYSDSSKRHLCIVKGNYIQEKEKDKSLVLHFNERMRYTILPERVPFNQLAKPDARKPDNSKTKALAVKLKQEGMSITKIQERLKADGHQVGRSTIGDWVRDCPASDQP